MGKIPVCIDIETIPRVEPEVVAHWEKYEYKVKPEYLGFENLNAPTEADKERYFSKVFEPHKGLKDPVKIEAHRQSKMAKFFEAARTHKFDEQHKWLEKRKFQVGGAQVVSIALCTLGPERIHDPEVKCCDDETKLAAFAVTYLNDLAPSEYALVGFNIDGFDLPHLARIISAAKLRLTQRIGKWSTVDLMYKPLRGHGTAKQIMSAFGASMPDDHGSAVSQLWEDGELEQIAEYNVQDVLGTAKVFWELSRTYGLL